MNVVSGQLPVVSKGKSRSLADEPQIPPLRFAAVGMTNREADSRGANKQQIPRCARDDKHARIGMTNRASEDEREGKLGSGI